MKPKINKTQHISNHKNKTVAIRPCGRVILKKDRMLLGIITGGLVFFYSISI